MAASTFLGVGREGNQDGKRHKDNQCHAFYCFIFLLLE